MITIIILFGFALLKISLLIARSNEPIMRLVLYTAFWISINHHRQNLLFCWLWKKWSQIRSSSSINMFSSGITEVYMYTKVGKLIYFVFANHPSLIPQYGPKIDSLGFHQWKVPFVVFWSCFISTIGDDSPHGLL